MQLLKSLYNYVLKGTTTVPKGNVFITEVGSTSRLKGTVQLGANADADSRPVTIVYSDVQLTTGAVIVDRLMQVSSIQVRSTTAATTACTLTMYKVPAGTTGYTSGVVMNVTAISMSGTTASINKSLNLTASISALQLATGDAVGAVFSAAPEGLHGSITINLKPI